jgi:hypothetical protein
VVIVLAIGLKVRGFKPGEDAGFLREIKIRNTTQYRKVLQHVKDTCDV